MICIKAEAECILKEVQPILDKIHSLITPRDADGSPLPVTERPVTGALVALSLPIIGGEVMQLAYNLADTFWLGRLGTEQLAAISFAFPIIFIVISLAAGFSISGSTLVAQHTGAGQKKEANHAAGQVLVFLFSLALVVSMLGIRFGRWGLNMLGPEPEVLEYAWVYFRILCASIPFIFIYYIFQSVFQAVGDTVTPMIIKVGSVGLNVVLDPVLIFGLGPFPHMGIAGAAVATVFTRLLATAVGLFLLFTPYRGGLHLRPADLIPDSGVILQVIKIGAPAAGSISALSFARTFMTGIVGAFGTATVAAWGVVNRLMSVLRMLSKGTSRSTTILVGQHLGADQADQAERSAWISSGLTFGLLLMLGLVGFAAAPAVIAVFDPTPEVVSIGTEYLRIAVFAYASLSVQQVLCGGLRGAGNTVEDAAIRLITQWGMQIPLAYYLTTLFDRLGIWWSVFLSRFLGALMTMVWFRRGSWKEAVIERTPQHG